MRACVRRALRWVQTCNVTAYRDAVTLQATDTIRSYGLNFHPVPHGMTVSCRRSTMGFLVCHGSPSDVLAVSSCFVYIYIYLKKKRKGWRWRQMQVYRGSKVCSGSCILADLSFRSVSGLYKNFTRMSPSAFEFLINFIRGKISKKNTAFRKAISVQERLALTLRFLAVVIRTLICSTL
jgi:hypothetical protein